MLWMMFIHSKESVVLKVCNLFFGRPTLSAPDSMLQYVDPIIISLSVSIIVLVIVQLSGKKKVNDKHVEECFDGVA